MIIFLIQKIQKNIPHKYCMISKEIYRDNLNFTKFLKSTEEFNIEIFLKFYLCIYSL